MNKSKEFLEKHHKKLKYLAFVYTIFAGCFTFPLWSERFPLDFMKVYLILMQYGAIGLLFALVYKKGKGKVIYLYILSMTIAGLVCRYLLEFGEASNIYNFTPLNIGLYISFVPLLALLFYYWTDKYTMKDN